MKKKIKLEYANNMQTDSQHFIAMIHQMRTMVSQIKLEDNLSISEYCVISIIYHHSENEKCKLTPTKLNDLLGTKKPATSRLLSILEKRGFIYKENDENDHRVCYLILSPKAKDMIQREQSYLKELFHRIIESIGEKDMIQLTQSMEKVNHILESELSKCDK